MHWRKKRTRNGRPATRNDMAIYKNWDSKLSIVERLFCFSLSFLYISTCLLQHCLGCSGVIDSGHGLQLRGGKTTEASPAANHYDNTLGKRHEKMVHWYMALVHVLGGIKWGQRPFDDCYVHSDVLTNVHDMRNEHMPGIRYDCLNIHEYTNWFSSAVLCVCV